MSYEDLNNLEYFLHITDLIIFCEVQQNSLLSAEYYTGENTGTGSQHVYH